MQLWLSRFKSQAHSGSFLADRFPFYCVLFPRDCFCSVSGTVSLAFVDALPPLGVWLARDGCHHFVAMDVLEPLDSLCGCSVSSLVLLLGAKKAGGATGQRDLALF